MPLDLWHALDHVLAPLGSSALELLGFVFGVAAVWLMTRQHIAAWPVGIVNVALYAVLFTRAGLYSDAGLQVVYVGLSAYGWWRWTRGAAPTTHDPYAPAVDVTPLPVTRTPPREALLAALVALLLWITLALVTSRLPGTSLPWLDSALVSGSLVTQWLAARKRLENWACWIVLDVLYVGLFVYKALLLTAALYAVFIALAVRGHLAWSRTVQQST
jgi:nicotinamide mononucleotide transporter